MKNKEKSQTENKTKIQKFVDDRLLNPTKLKAALIADSFTDFYIKYYITESPVNDVLWKEFLKSNPEIQHYAKSDKLNININISPEHLQNMITSIVSSNILELENIDNLKGHLSLKDIQRIEQVTVNSINDLFVKLQASEQIK